MLQELGVIHAEVVKRVTDGATCYYVGGVHSQLSSQFILFIKDEIHTTL